MAFRKISVCWSTDFHLGLTKSAARHSSVMNLFPAFTRSEPHGVAGRNVASYSSGFVD
jgi:hypothetical protein